MSNTSRWQICQELEMAQSIKHLPLSHWVQINSSSWIWIPRTHVKPDTVADLCDLSSPITRREVETGKSRRKAPGPASLANAVVKDDRPCLQQDGRWGMHELVLSHPHTCIAQVHLYTHTKKSFKNNYIFFLFLSYTINSLESCLP